MMIKCQLFLLMQICERLTSTINQGGGANMAALRSRWPNPRRAPPRHLPQCVSVAMFVFLLLLAGLARGRQMAGEVRQGLTLQPLHIAAITTVVAIGVRRRSSSVAAVAHPAAECGCDAAR